MSRLGDSSPGLAQGARWEKVRSALATIALLPHSRIKIFLLRRLLGWEIHPTARMGSCIFYRVQHVTLGPNACLRSLSVYRHLERLAVGASAAIGSWNWIGAAPHLRTPTLDRRTKLGPAQLTLGRHASVTSRHYFDCSGGIAVGDFSVVGGVRSTILTHQVDTAQAEQDVAAVTIGDYCFVGSNVKTVPGTQIPDRCVIGMGSVVRSGLKEPDMLYAGVPARPIKRIAGKYFERDSRVVWIP